ncbi:MAG: UDP-N-acetylmuramoyl-tripeptide--D-alanyl-D-alanine ligase [Alphaproteobacteria bacterium]
MSQKQSPLWSAAEAAETLQPLGLGQSFFQDCSPGAIQGVSIDTRTLHPQDLFVALKGQHQDGHAYVSQAIAKGATAALVCKAEIPSLLTKGLPEKQLWGVEDTLEGLEALAKAARQRSSGKSIGITGSVGKTTLKEALGVLLSSQHFTHISALSHNNHWGVPLSLARFPREAAYGVFEMGMNRPGEIAKLTELVQPHVALVSTIAPAHRAFFPSLEAIAEAKAEIFSGLVPGGVAVIPHDHCFRDLLMEKALAHSASVLTFGVQKGASIQLLEQKELPHQGGYRLTIQLPEGKKTTLNLPMLGNHWILNALALVSILIALGLDPTDFEQAFETLRPIKGRGAVHHLAILQGSITLIDESYNANPESVRAALEAFGKTTVGGGRKLVVLGDMLELGDLGPAYHLELKPLLEAQAIDKVFACGLLMEALYKSLSPGQQGAWSPKAADLWHPLQASLQDGDAVMLKGSNSLGLGDLVSKFLEMKV